MNIIPVRKTSLIKTHSMVRNPANKSLLIPILILILLLGIALRVGFYFSDRSLNTDESALAVNIIQRPLNSLWQSPEDLKDLGMREAVRLQAAPLGFMFLEKLTVSRLGENEFVLKFWPLVFGILALIGFYYVARQHLCESLVPLAFFLFAISEPLVHFSANVKQYSCEVFVAVLLLGMFSRVAAGALRLRSFLLYSFLGAIAVWFSFSSIFILFGISLGLLLSFASRREWGKFREIVLLNVLWAISFLIYYFLILSRHLNDPIITSYWQKYCLVIPSMSLHGLMSFLWDFFTISRIFANLPYAIPDTSLRVIFLGITAFIFILGCLSLYFRKKISFIIILFPIFATAIASLFGKYPFTGRLMLFSFPMALLLITEGIGMIINVLTRDTRWPGALILTAFLVAPIFDCYAGVAYPYQEDHVKPALSFIQKHWYPKDILYVYYGALNQFEYYESRYGFKAGDCQMGIPSRDTRTQYLKDLKKLEGHPRVWLLFSHVYQEEDKFFLSHLDKIGKKIKDYQGFGASAYLFDLRAAK